MVEDLKLCQPKELAAQFFLADQQINSVISTSAGRLFDGVSAILGLCRMSTFQGQAAMSLQFAAERWEGAHGAMEVQPIEPSTATDGACCRRWPWSKISSRNAFPAKTRINWPMNFTADWPAWSSASAKVFAVKRALRQRLSAAASFKTVCSSAFVTRRCSSGALRSYGTAWCRPTTAALPWDRLLCDVSRNCLNR